MKTVMSAAPTRTRTPNHVASLDKHRALVASANWLHPTEGYRLQVHPTLYGRTVADRYPGRALRESMRLARPTPTHLSNRVIESLRNQLRCHGAFAPDKAAWDLETWRPDVGYLSTVLHACNP